MRSSADNYTVYRFMTGELGLRGAALQVYALIYSFTTVGGSFSGSRAYIADTVGVSLKTVERAIAELSYRGLITRQTKKSGFATFEYIAAAKIV